MSDNKMHTIIWCMAGGVLIVIMSGLFILSHNTKTLIGKAIKDGADPIAASVALSGPSTGELGYLVTRNCKEEEN